MQKLCKGMSVIRQPLCIFIYGCIIFCFFLFFLLSVLFSLCLFFNTVAKEHPNGVLTGNAFWDTLTPQLPAGNGRGSSLCPCL